MSCSFTLSLRFLITKVWSGSRLVRCCCCCCCDCCDLELVLLLLLLVPPAPELCFELLPWLLLEFAFVVLLLPRFFEPFPPTWPVVSLDARVPISLKSASLVSAVGKGGLVNWLFFSDCGAFLLGVFGALPPDTTKLAQEPGAGFEVAGCVCACCWLSCLEAPLLFFLLFPSFTDVVCAFFLASSIDSEGFELATAGASSFSNGASSFDSSTPPPGATSSTLLSVADVFEAGNGFVDCTTIFFSFSPTSRSVAFTTSSLVAESVVTLLTLAATAAADVASVHFTGDDAGCCCCWATRNRKISLITLKFLPNLAKKNVWTNFLRRVSPMSLLLKMTHAVTTNSTPPFVAGWASIAPSSNSKSIFSSSLQPQRSVLKSLDFFSWFFNSSRGTGSVGSDPSPWLKYDVASCKSVPA